MLAHGSRHTFSDVTRFGEIASMTERSDGFNCDWFNQFRHKYPRPRPRSLKGDAVHCRRPKWLVHDNLPLNRWKVSGRTLEYLMIRVLFFGYLYPAFRLLDKPVDFCERTPLSFLFLGLAPRYSLSVRNLTAGHWLQSFKLSYSIVFYSLFRYEIRSISRTIHFLHCLCEADTTLETRGSSRTLS